MPCVHVSPGASSPKIKELVIQFVIPPLYIISTSPNFDTQSQFQFPNGSPFHRARRGCAHPRHRIRPGTGINLYKYEHTLNRSAIDSIRSAIAAGHRHLDCAEIYRTESKVGVAIKESGIAREELFITTKVCITSERNYTNTPSPRSCAT